MLKKKMSDVSEQIRGVSYKPEDILSGPGENAIGILRANNIADGAVNFDDLVYVKKSKVSQKQMLRKGDILICTSSGSKNLVGKAAQIEEDCNYSFGAFCKVIRPQKINPGFLGMYFQSSLYRQYISEVSQGANINNIKNVHIDAIEIEGYSENEQKKIAELLERIVKIIKIRKQQISVLDTLIKSRFIEMFDGDYKEVTANEVCVAIIDCPHSTPKYNETELRYPAIRTSEIQNGTINWTSMKYVGPVEYEKRIKRLKPKAGDVVYAREGTYGDCVILPPNVEFCLGQRTMLFRPNKQLCTSVYLHAVLRSEKVKRQADESNAGSTVPHINVADAKKFHFALPPMELQEQFAIFVAQTNKSKAIVQVALDKAQLLFDSLMQKYFG